MAQLRRGPAFILTPQGEAAQAETDRLSRQNQRVYEDEQFADQTSSDSRRRRRKRRGQIQPATILGDTQSASSTQTLLGA